MLKVFVDGNDFHGQLRQCKYIEGQTFCLKLTKVEHEKLGQWNVYFNTLPKKDEKSEIDPDIQRLAHLVQETDYGLGDEQDLLLNRLAARGIIKIE